MEAVSDKNFTTDIPEGLARTKQELIEKIQYCFKLEGVSALPLFSVSWKDVHPALDYVDGVAYVGVYLPTKEVDDKGRERIREHHYLVTSKRELILCHGKELAKRNLKLKHKAVKIPNRWSLESIKAWLDGKATVEPIEAYTAVKTVFEEYMEFEDPIIYDFLTLWVIGTYLFPIFEAYPYIYVGGMKGVGKTKLLTLLSHLCFNAKFSGSFTSSCLFRNVESQRCTYLLDETENLAYPEKAEDIRSLLLNGYKRGGVASRVNKDTHTPEDYEVYSPKAIANIKGLENVLEDRCISLIIKKGKNPKLLNSEPKHENPIWQQIRDMLYIFALERFSELSEHSERGEHWGEPLLVGRNQELWKPILVLAKYFSQWVEGVYERILEFAIAKTKERLTENMTETAEYLLVETLIQMVDKAGYYKVMDIKKSLEEQFEEPQNWLTTKWVGNALRRLGFKDKKRLGRGYVYKLTPEAVKDLAQRLGIQISSNEESITEEIINGNSKSLNPKEEDSKNLSTQRSLSSLCSLSSLTKENFERVWNALVEASKVRGSASLDEISSLCSLPRNAVETVLKEMEKEGKAYQPFPEWWKVAEA